MCHNWEGERGAVWPIMDVNLRLELNIANYIRLWIWTDEYKIVALTLRENHDLM
jgi:hypothetical protein